MSKILRKVHKHPLLLPKNQLPNWLVMVFGPLFGLSRDYMRKHLGIRFRLDNRRSIEELGIVYRPVEETLADHYKSWDEARRRTAVHAIPPASEPGCGGAKTSGVEPAGETRQGVQ